MSQLSEWFKGWNSIKDVRRNVKAELTPELVAKITAAFEKEMGKHISHEDVVCVVSWALRYIGG